MTDAISPLNVTMSQAFLGAQTGPNLSNANMDKHPFKSIANEPVGGSGGSPFALRNEAHDISKIKVWMAKGSRHWCDRQLIKDIKITWNDGVSKYITGNQSGTSIDFDFEEDTKITKMTLRAGNRIDRITFFTDKERNGDPMKFDVGDMENKENGSPHDQLLGNGILCGFHGTFDDSAKELISLGAYFKN